MVIRDRHHQAIQNHQMYITCINNGIMLKFQKFSVY